MGTSRKQDHALHDQHHSEQHKADSPRLSRRTMLAASTLFAVNAVFPWQRALALPSAMATPPAPTKDDLWSRYWIGTSYYPEQWPQKAWAEDFARMEDLGVNMVRMGEFAWSTFEPSEGHFEFGWLDTALELAHRHGIAVLLGTPTAAVPPWLHASHPDVLGGNEKGLYTYGGRKGFSLFSPAMRSAAEKLIREMAKRYGSHPAIVGWQLGNEPGYPMEEFDPIAEVAFRSWLKQRYGTLDKLNATWSGAFWSNTYDSWDEIVFPTNSPEGGWYPTLRLDYRRFFSDSFLNWLRMEEKIVREHAQGQFIYTNWPDTRWSVDIREAQSFLDAAAWDNYAKMPGTAPAYEVLYAGMDHDLCRCSRSDQHYFVSEQPALSDADVPVASVRLSTFIDAAHGSHGTVFFEWRPPLIGSERGYYSMMEADGTPGISADIFRRMKSEFSLLNPHLAGTRTVADVALLYSYTNQWEQGSSWTDKGKRNYDGICQQYYAGARSLQRNVDVVGFDHDLSGYRLLFAPALRDISDEQSEALIQFVRNGGTLVLDHGAGTLDASGRLRTAIEPGPFRAAAGARVWASSGSHAQPHAITLQFEGTKRKFSVGNEIARIELEGATALATFSGEGIEGSPAITIHPCGKGSVVFVGAEFTDHQLFAELARTLASRLSLLPLLAVPDGVSVLSRTTGKEELLFVLNLNRRPCEVTLPSPMRNLLTQTTASGRIQIGALDLAVLARKQA